MPVSEIGGKDYKRSVLSALHTRVADLHASFEKKHQSGEMTSYKTSLISLQVYVFHICRYHPKQVRKRRSAVFNSRLLRICISETKNKCPCRQVTKGRAGLNKAPLSPHTPDKHKYTCIRTHTHTHECFPLKSI